MANASSSSSSVLESLADPAPRLIDAAVMDYFMIEAVEALRQSSAVAAARVKKAEDEMINAGLLPPPPPPPPHLKKGNLRDSVMSNATDKSHPDEEDEDLRARLEAIGLHVGTSITERYDIVILPRYSFSSELFTRLCHDRPIFSDTLDNIKFICKDLWAACWDKQVDNLRTNHRVRFITIFSRALLTAKSGCLCPSRQ